MKNSCNIDATSKTGKPSKLFRELVNLMDGNRAIARDELYKAALSQNFLSKYKDRLVIDEETQEPTLESLIKIPEIQRKLENSNTNVLNYIEKKYGFFKKDTYQKFPYSSLFTILDNISTFNNTPLADDYALVIQKINDNFYVRAKKRNILTQEEKVQQEKIPIVFKQLSILNNMNQIKGSKVLYEMLNDILPISSIEEVGNVITQELFTMYNNLEGNKNSKISQVMHSYIKHVIELNHSDNKIVAVNSLREILAQEKNIDTLNVSDNEVLNILTDLIIDYNNDNDMMPTNQKGKQE